MEQIKCSHPWGVFLRARVAVLQWLRDEMGESHAQSARTLSMDETQVMLILEGR